MTDAHDAYSVAMVAMRTKGLRVLQVDGELEALRLLVERRESLTGRRVQTVDRLQLCLRNCFRDTRRRTSPPAKPSSCSPRSVHATSPGRHGDGSRPRS